MWLRLLLLLLLLSSLSWSPFLCLDVCLQTSGLSVAAPGRKLRISHKSIKFQLLRVWLVLDSVSIGCMDKSGSTVAM